MDVVAAVATTSGKREVMRQATAYYAFVKAKDETGKERATLNAVLAADRFDDEKFQRTFVILAAQNTYLDIFRKYGSAAALTAFDENAKSPIYQKVEELRSAVLAKGMAGGFGIAPETWFPVITDKINAMKVVEDILTKEILSTAGDLAHDAKLALVVSLTLTCLAVILTFARLRTAADRRTLQAGIACIRKTAHQQRFPDY